MKLVKLFAIAIALLVVTSVTMSNRSLSDSQTVADLSREIAHLEKENILTSAEIADAGSLTKISERVEAMGFEPGKKVVSVSLPGNVASR